jgi:hypothetical protein
MGEVIKSYKGFNKNMTCRGFQYEEGKEYEEEIVEVCDHGFHACEYPLDCLNYYYPNESVYHEVEQSGEIQKHNDDTKVASTKIKIGAEISIAGLVKAAIEYTVKRVKKDAESDEKHGASSATGTCGASSATGDYGASSATGTCGASSATGYKGASSATGDYGASSATGDYGASSATGYKGASSATGTCGASSATGYFGASSAEDKDVVAVAWGYKSKAKGVLGAFLVFADWEYTGSKDNPEYDRNNQSAWVLNGAKMVQVNGDDIKPDTWYTIENGEIEEVSE